MIDADEVTKAKTAYIESKPEKDAPKEAIVIDGEGPEPGAETLEGDGAITSISANQTQEYFAIATDRGFEIIQNDSSN